MAHNPYAAPQTNVARADDTEYGELRILSARGRIGRVRYIGYSAGLGLVTTLFMLVFGVIGAMVDPWAAIAAIVIGYAAMIVIGLLFTIQRSHDMNVSGWLSLILLIPLGALVFWLVPGTAGENRYGKPPPPNSAGVVVLACLVPLLGFFGGIVAAIAIPAYQDYVIRAQVSEGLNLAAAAKAAVEDSFVRTGAAPADRLAAGMSAAPADTAGLYVAGIDVERGTILVAYSGNAHEAIAGGVLALQPYVAGDRVVWRCGHAVAPAGALPMDGSAIPSAAVTNIDPRLLPSACRP